jgi:Zn-dependent M28 family amino/carboxypeptidase
VNVIGHFGAARPGSAHGALVLCAHYDSRPFADQDPDSARRNDPVPAANDGGSGVAVLLEIADLLARKPAPCPVDLVFFDGEDQGRNDAPETFSRGARGYAARLASPRPRGAFLFDMVGDRDLAIYTEGFSLERASNLTDLVLEAARAVGASHFHADTRHHVIDDHIPLLDAGVPAVDLIDFDYPAWHTTHDLPDQVSAESLAEVARVGAWLVYRSPLARLP